MRLSRSATVGVRGVALVLVVLAPAGAAAQPRGILVLPWSVGDDPEPPAVATVAAAPVAPEPSARTSRTQARQAESSPRAPAEPPLRAADPAPTSGPRAPNDPALLAARAEALADAIGGAAMRIEEVRRRFEQDGSAEPPSFSDSDLERWLALSRQAIRQIAHTDYDAARQTLLEADRLAARAAEELNRELTTRRQLLDTCLYEVRAYIETHDPRAESRALECRRLVPRVQPSPYNHTPEVIELLERLDRRLAQAPPGRLAIESEPSGCTVRLNGVEFGRTPFLAEDLARGEYRAQVECEEGTRGRVHRIAVSEDTRIELDLVFDTAVRTDTALRLRYGSEEEASRRLSDALAAASVVGASEVWLLRNETEETVRIDRVAAGRPVASARASLAALGEAVEALRAGRSVDLSGPEPAPLTAWDPRGRAAAASDPAGAIEGQQRGGAGLDPAVLGTGIALGVVGLGGLVGSWAFYGWRAELGPLLVASEPGDGRYLERQQRWIDAQSGLLATGAIGSALAIASLPLLMVEEDGVPWWSWVLGGAGVAILAGGIALLALSPACPLSEEHNFGCVERGAGVDRGAILIATSAPFLAVPIVYGLREVVRPARVGSVSIEVTEERVLARIGGAW